MALRVVLDNLEGLDESLHEHYTEKDGKFFMDIEDDIRRHPKGVSLVTAIERMKAEKTTLTAKLAEVEARIAELPEGFDAEQYAADMDELASLKKKLKPGEGDDDDDRQSQKKLYEQRIANLEAKHNTEIGKLHEEKAGLVGHIERLMGDEGLTKALVAAGVDKKLLPGATALLRRSVKVKQEDGEWRSFVETDIGESSIDDFVSNWAQSDEGAVYLEKARGGDAKGGNGHRMDFNPWDNQGGKVKPNLTKQQEMVVANPEKARQMARAAGAPVTW